MKRYIALLAVGTMLCHSSYCQDWTLERCIEYAEDNNVSIMQSEVAVKSQEITLNTAVNSRLPYVSAGLNGSTYFGRGPSRDGTYTDNTQLSSSANLDLSTPIYSGSKIKHTIQSEKLSLEASLLDLEKAKESLSVSITILYMQVLYNKELVKVAESQLELSKSELERSKLLFEGGRVAESDIYDAMSLVANDELSLTQCRNELQTSILDLEQSLNIDTRGSVEILTPNITDLDLAAMRNVDEVANIYNIALGERPIVAAEEVKLKVAEKAFDIARSAKFPTITLGAGYSNSAYYSYLSGYDNTRINEQLSQNGSEYIALSISVPIFSRFSTRNNMRSAKLGIENQKLSLINIKQQLFKEIEQSHLNVVSSYDQYLSASHAVKAAKVAFAYAEERSAAGSATIFDFNDAKSRLEQAEIDQIKAKYEFVFRVKILDFYSGTPLGFRSYL